MSPSDSSICPRAAGGSVVGQTSDMARQTPNSMPRFKAYAAANGHTYLDYFSAMTDEKGLLRAELSADDLHPNAGGYNIMAPLAEAAIAKALGGK